MRIWLPTLRAGTGADVFTRRLATALRGRGVEAEVTWFPARYEFLPELMRRHSAPAGTDLIHANGWLASPFVGRGIPVVTTVHHLVHDPAYAPFRSAAQALYHRAHVRWREGRAIAGSEVVTAVSAYVADTVREEFGRQYVEVIHNWVDTEFYRPSSGYSPDPSRPFRLLLSGNASRRKGFDLLPALSSALGNDFEIRITGGLRDGKVPATANAVFLGRLDEAELVHEYQECDAVISLSRYEGFGYTALEGMACSKPFLGFRTSGLAEVVVEGTTGLLCPVDDVEALARNCMKVRLDADLARCLGEAGRRTALEQYAQSKALESYERIYRQCVGR